MSIKSTVFEFLSNTLLLCQKCPDASDLIDHIHDMQKRLKEPLRVAVIGGIKAGKSTFMNALIGKNIVYTGTLETTYTVCWFRYADKPFLTIYFHSGKEVEVPFEDLGKWSVRSYEKENPQLNDVKYIIINYPAKVLKNLEFIDTPGLNSFYGTDAQNTLDFLALRGSEDTLKEASMADAVIYAFSRSAADEDQKILKQFSQGNYQMSPIHSIGILTRADSTGIWQLDDEITPVEKAREVTSNIMRNPDMKKLLFTIMPVCAKACEGYSQLQEQDWITLKNLASVSKEDLQDLLFDAGEFKNNEEDYKNWGTKESRTHLIDCLGQYGIIQIAQLLRDGKEIKNIGEELQELCGMQEIQQILFRHFGKRTFLIKAQYIFSYLNKLAFEIKNNSQSSPSLKNIAEQMLGDIEYIKFSFIENIQELDILQMFYNGDLNFMSEEEKEDLLRITGEKGSSLEERLGIKYPVSIAELSHIVEKKINDWNNKEALEMIMPASYKKACSMVIRSYEQVYYHLSALLKE